MDETSHEPDETKSFLEEPNVIKFEPAVELKLVKLSQQLRLIISGISVYDPNMDIREIELYIRELAQREGGVVLHSLSVCRDIVDSEVREAIVSVIDGIFMGELEGDDLKYIFHDDPVMLEYTLAV